MNFFSRRYGTPAPERLEVDRMYYSDSQELRRENMIAVQAIPDHRHAHQRYSPRENHQGSGANAGTRYQASPVLTAAPEDYDAPTMTVPQPGSAAVHLGSPAPYSPPIDGIRTGQQHMVATSYADASGVIKYDAETTAATDSIKASNTYTTLETVAIPPTQSVQYTQYLSSGETFHQPSTCSYKSGDPVILTYPSQLGPKVSVRDRDRFYGFSS